MFYFKNHVFYITLIFLFIFSCGTQKKIKQENALELPAIFYYKQALNLVEAQKYKQALKQLDTAIVLKPEFAQFYYARGQIYELLGKNLLAIDSYETALKYKSFFPDAWKSVSLLYMNEKEYDKAIQVLRNLVEIEPDSLNYEIMLADAYLHLNKPLLAFERIKNIENQQRDSREIFRIKGKAYFLNQNYKDAIENFEHYVKYKQDNFDALKYLGFAYIENGNLEKGISFLNRALSLYSDDPEIYLYRAVYFMKQGKYDMALDQFNLALNIDNRNSVVLLEYSKFMLVQGDTTTAKKLLKSAIIYDKYCWECFKYLGIIADDQGQDFDAILYLQKYLSNIYHRDPEVELRMDNLLKGE